MQTELRTLLAQVVPEVLERHAFLFCDPDPEPADAAPPGVMLKGFIHFRGIIRGICTIAAPDDVSVEIAANVLGLEPDDPEARTQAHDALREVLNVITAHIVTAIAGENTTIDLTVPKVLPMPDGEWDELAKAPETVHFLVEDQPVLLRVQTDEDD